jgi:hypothetical protein
MEPTRLAWCTRHEPGNVFLCTYVGESEFVKVLDFGIAKSLERVPLTAAGGDRNAALHAAGSDPDHGPYVGMILAEMLSGQPVVGGRRPRQHVQLGPTPVSLLEVVERSVLGR